MTSAFRKDLFKGRVVLATGGGSGIGQEVVRGLMQHGCDAVIIGRRKDVLEAAAKELEASTGQRCLAIPSDVRDIDKMAAAAKQCVDTFGRLDFVIAGAAGNFLAPIEGMSSNAFATVISIDLLGVFNTIKATLPYVKKSKGSYIHITATLFRTGVHLQGHVSAAKAGITAFSNVLAVELGPFGVRSNCLLPGPIADTPGIDRLFTKDKSDYLVSQVPLQRLGLKSDIANAAIYLCSDAASFVTGSELTVDGGAWHRGQSVMDYPASVMSPDTFREEIKAKL